VTDRGFRQVQDVDEWHARVEFQGERLTLSFTHGNREFDFFAEIKYRKFPRKNPKVLWTVLEALGVSRGPIAIETLVDEDRLRTLVETTAGLVARHWEIIDRDPTRELFREVEKIENRHARQIRKL
jgi:hypothetical protein